MPTLLALDVSPRGNRSISSALGKRFVEHWQARHPGGTVIYRDYDAGEPSEADDLVTPVLRKALSFLGINDLAVVRAEGSLAVNLGRVRIEDHLERCAPEVAALAASRPARFAASEKTQ